MRVVEISKFDDSIVLHFETEGNKINAYTLASTLVAIADAAKAANAAVNLGYDIEIVVEAIGPGSFRAKLKAVYTTSKNLFSTQNAIALILGIIGNYIYERSLAVDESIKVQINTEEVIIESGDERIIVPRKVYDATRQVERSPKFVQAVNKTLDAIVADEQISAFGFVQDLDSPAPEILVSKEAIQKMNLDMPPDPTVRPIEEQCDLQIVRAILERGRRKWEFMWRGVRISAPVIDEIFWEEFFNRSITIAPGDILRVRLVIRQVLDERTGIYTNDMYEVAQVYEHVPRPRQMPLQN